MSIDVQSMLKNKQTPAPQQDQAATETVLKGPFAGYSSFLTSSGKPYTFYEGYLVTEDQEIITAALALPGVARTDETKFPRMPERNRGRKSVSFSENRDPTTITPQEIMQLAVASTRTVPQAAESNSGAH